MITREILAKERQEYNALVDHPLQSWEWGEFRKKTGHKVIRLGVFDGKKIKAGYQVTVHPIPKLPYTIIYFPKGPLPDKMMLKALTKIAQQENAILVKLEPNVGVQTKVKDFLLKNNCQVGQPLFTRYTFQLDLTKTEDQLLSAMKSKTRYNIKLSQRHGVKVVEDNSPKAFDTYLRLLWETIERQGFYAHTKNYHRKLWQTLKPAGIYHLFLAKYQNEVLAAYVFFTFNKVLYYPYGASTRHHREVMAPYALFWEAIKFGQKQGCHTFDMWGSLSSEPNPKDPWLGFHRFKKGFGGQLIEFIGTYDLVINSQLYPFYNLANKLRWGFLRLKSWLQ